MADESLSAAERQLAKNGVKITFFKALVKLCAIEERYPEGLHGFIEFYQRITLRDGLVGVTFGRTDALSRFAEQMAAFDIVEGRDFATANQLSGEISSCAGIRFITVTRLQQPETSQRFPVWYACAER